jgi:hypothetical protein
MLRRRGRRTQSADILTCLTRHSPKIDFLRRKLNLTRQIQRVSAGEMEIKAPKYGSVRVIYLPDELTTLLGRHVETHTFGRAADRWFGPGRAYFY